MTKFNMIFFMLIVLLLSSDHLIAEDKVSHPFVDRKVAGIVIGTDTIKDVSKLYGKGYIKGDGYPHNSRACYYFLNDGVSLLVFSGEDKDSSVETVVMMKKGAFSYSEYNFDGCVAKKQKNMTFKTGKGVQLGDSIEKVSKIYGKPQKLENSENGDVRMEYHTNMDEDPDVELCFDVVLRFKNNKLAEISIHDGE